MTGATDGPEALQKIAGFVFTNGGAFICSGKVMFTNPDGSTGTTDGWGNMGIGQTVVMRPLEKGVAQHAIVQLYIDIVAGNDRTGGINFLYGQHAKEYAQYEITGTTFFSDVQYQGITTNPPG